MLNRTAVPPPSGSLTSRPQTATARGNTNIYPRKITHQTHITTDKHISNNKHWVRAGLKNSSLLERRGHQTTTACNMTCNHPVRCKGGCTAGHAPVPRLGFPHKPVDVYRCWAGTAQACTLHCGGRRLGAPPGAEPGAGARQQAPLHLSAGSILIRNWLTLYLSVTWLPASSAVT